MSNKEVAAAINAITSTTQTFNAATDENDHKQEVKKRSKELAEEKRTHEKRFVNGRWITDSEALKRPDLRRHEKFQRTAPKRLAQANYWMKMEEATTGLETEEREVADRVTQKDIIDSVDLQTARKKFSLTLDKLGPYKIDFTVNGTHLLLAGLRGHMANIQWKDFALNGEVQLKDKINDATFLVDHTMTAVAQKKYVYMYTKEGTEMHILSKMINMDRLAYLPRHMLLAAASSHYSVMQYMDISTGQELGSKVPSVMRDPTSCMAVNPSNGVVSTCDLRGVVKFWTPSVVDPLVQLKGHKGVVDAIRFHDSGRFFVTLSNSDHKLKVWDCRTLRALEEYGVTYTFNTLDVSSSGLVALGGGTNVQIWKDMFTASKPNAPYMKFGLGYGNIAEQVRFCPFEDILGIGTSRGFESIIVPGSGEANPDFYYANPHETERHRKERVVTQLLDKLPPDMISMDIQVPGVNNEHLEAYNRRIASDRRARVIREKKLRRADRSLGDEAPTGVATRVGNDDELEEEIEFQEKSRTKDLRTRKERLQDKNKEKKMKRWDQKDSSDKVRSKQTMRHSRMVEKMRKSRDREDRKKRRMDKAAKENGTDSKTPSGKRSQGDESADDRNVSSKRPRRTATFGSDDDDDSSPVRSRGARNENDGLRSAMSNNAALKRFL